MFFSCNRGECLKEKVVSTEEQDILGFSGGKEAACNAKHTGDSGPTRGWEDPLEKGNGSPLQYSCLENSVDRGAWRATVRVR